MGSDSNRYSSSPSPLRILRIVMSILRAPPTYSCYILPHPQQKRKNRQWRIACNRNIFKNIRTIDLCQDLRYTNFSGVSQRRSSVFGARLGGYLRFFYCFIIDHTIKEVLAALSMYFEPAVHVSRNHIRKPVHTLTGLKRGAIPLVAAKCTVQLVLHCVLMGRTQLSTSNLGQQHNAVCVT